MATFPAGLIKEMPRWRTCLPAGRIGRRTAFRIMFFVYVIKSCERNYLYVGMTGNVEKRVKQHNNGANRSTKAYRPFELVYTEEFVTREKAREREKYLKSGIGKEFLKRLIK